MKHSTSRGLNRKVSLLKKRCPWMASLILHCLESQNPKACEEMKLLLSRLRLNSV